MFEWFNNVLPLMNTAGMKDIAVLRVGPTATGVDLRSLFGNRTGVPTGSPAICAPSGLPNIDAGHFYSIKADGAGPVATGLGPWRAYIAMASSVRAIDETSLGTASGCCWPIVDGETLRGRMVAGMDRATGLATGFVAPVMNFKSAPGAGTGWLRVYRSSLGDGQDTAEFRAPGVP